MPAVRLFPSLQSFRMIKPYIGEDDDNVCPDKSQCPPEFSCLMALTRFGCCPLAQVIQHCPIMFKDALCSIFTHYMVANKFECLGILTGNKRDINSDNLIHKLYLQSTFPNNRCETKTKKETKPRLRQLISSLSCQRLVFLIVKTTFPRIPVPPRHKEGLLLHWSKIFSFSENLSSMRFGGTTSSSWFVL